VSESSKSKVLSGSSLSKDPNAENLGTLCFENVDKYLRSREKKKVILGLNFVLDNFEDFDNKFLMKYMNGFVILLKDKIALLQEKSLAILFEIVISKWRDN
jgi:hypothetical protein